MLVYCPDPQAMLPGLPDDALAAFTVPTLVFRSGASDPYHTRATSEGVQGLIRGSRLVEPPWGDREWIERQGVHEEGLFARWPKLAPQLLEWQAATVG